MNLTGNTILITGGGSGIGRGLAEAFHGLGNQVIIAGRRMAVLEKVTSENPRMRAVELDVDSRDSIRALARKLSAEFSTLNVLINNAGIQRPEDLRKPSDDLADVEAMVTTNLLGPIRLTSALLPMLMRQPRATMMNVTSGLAFVPRVGVPTYCATKAAMHSYTLSLRYQLQDTSVGVIELIPPYVQTNLGPGHGVDPRAMPLGDFVNEVMAILREKPDVTEVVVERAKRLRFAEATGKFDETFTGMNDAMAAAGRPS
jgi:uncharacterized oxidoreductase